MRSRPYGRKQALVLVTASLFLLNGCSSMAAPTPSDSSAPPAKTAQPETGNQTAAEPEAPQQAEPGPAQAPPQQSDPQPERKPSDEKPAKKQPSAAASPALEVVAEPASITVLVNKQRKLPENYQPKDLVFPNVPFLLPEKSEKRKMRKEAAAALERLFAAAKKDGISLAGVSAYRSHANQTALFNRYVKQDGEEKARTYSAVPGTSEHETGLAIDVSGIDGKCAATSCFADTAEAKWLELHAPEYGFIIRYPKGRDDVTGYMYEPWHLRYVGTELSKQIAEKGVTLEEYFGAVPVAGEHK